MVADMRAGWIDSLVLQNPFRMGYESTRAIGLKLAGAPVPALVDSGATLVLREHLDTPETKALLFPDIRKYLKGR